MSSLKELLRNIGLTDKEAQTYLISLKVGSNPASIIAKNTEINRCTTYSILESLAKKGLVTQFEKGKIKFFTALPPNKLVTYVDERRSDLAYFKHEILTFLPKFQAIRHEEQIKPSIQSYSGKSGLMQVYHSVILEDTLSIWCVHAKEKHEFFHRFAPEFIKQNKTLKIIRYSNRDIIKLEIKNTADLNELKNIQPVEFITEEKVFLTSGSDSYAVEIVNPAIVKYFKNKFDLYWRKQKGLKPIAPKPF